MKKFFLWALVLICLPAGIYCFSWMGQFDGIERLAWFLVGLAVVLPGALAAAVMLSGALGDFAASVLFCAGGKLSETPEILSPIQGLINAGAFEEAALRLEEELDKHPRSEGLALLKMENLLAMKKETEAQVWAASFLLHPHRLEKCGEDAMQMALLYCDLEKNSSVAAEKLLQKLLDRAANDQIRKMMEMRRNMVLERLQKGVTLANTNQTDS